MSTKDEIVVRDDGIQILEAPDESLITLEVLHMSNGRGMHVHAGHIILGTPPHHVIYKVVGWDPATCALMVVKVAPSVIA